MKARVVLCGLAVALLLGTSLWAQRRAAGRVVGVHARVAPANWNGRCPRLFDFEAQIHANGPGTFYYEWQRSDGFTGPRQSVSFGMGGGTHDVRTRWDLIKPPNVVYHGWARVQVEGGPRSNPAQFELHCRR